MLGLQVHNSLQLLLWLEMWIIFRLWSLYQHCRLYTIIIILNGFISLNLWILVSTYAKFGGTVNLRLPPTFIPTSISKYQ